MRLKKTIVIVLLLSTLTAALGVLLKIKGEKVAGDIVLVISTASFYYFIYNAFLRKRIVKK